MQTDAILIFTIVALAKIIEVLIIKFMPEKSCLTELERHHLSYLHELHAQKDKDGVPLVYVPRSWAETQKDMKDVMQRIVNDQTRIADILERIEKKLEK
jgi:hypothetical protein